MFNPKTKKQTLVTRLLLPVLSAVILIVSFVTYFERPNRAEAATSSSINFQARLLTAAGQVVPDGNYNVEFKLYYASAPDAGETPDQGACTVNSNAASDEDCVWVETRTGGNRVRTVNGYLTVNLGSVTAFGSSINWDQDIWLTMNVGGGGVTASWDGEMTPRLKLTAVPYAMRAGVLAGGSGANVTILDTGTPSGSNLIHLPAESGTICLRTSTNCGFATGSGDADYIQNGVTTQAANFNVQAATSGSVAAVIQANAAGTGNILELKNGGGANVATFGSTGAVLFKNSTNNDFGFEIQDASADSLLRVNTNNRKVAIGVYSTSDTTGQLYVAPTSDTRTGVHVRGFSATFSSTYYEAVDSSGNNIFRVQATGNVQTATGVFISNNQSSASTNSTNGTVGSGAVSGATSNSGTATLKSGNSSASGNTGNVFVTSGDAASGNSGDVNIDVGTATGTYGTVKVGNANTGTILVGNASKSQAVTVGSTNSTSTTTIQGGNGASAISLTTATNGSINVTTAGNGDINLTSTDTIIAKATNNFQVQNSSNSALIYANTSTSRVGINTTPTTRTLEVGGDVSFALNSTSTTSQIVKIEQTGTGDSGVEIRNTTLGYYLGIDSSDASKFKITSSTSGGTSNMGYTTVGASTNTGDSGTMNATKFTAGSTGTVTTMYAAVGATIGSSPNNQAQVAIYSDSSGNPGALLGSSSASTLTASSWVAFTLTAPVNITNGTVYWLVYNTNGTTTGQNNLKYDSGSANQTKSVSQTYGTWPSSWSGGSFSSVQFSMYAVIDVTASNNLNSGLFELSSNGQAKFKNNSDSAVGFQLQRSNADVMFTADTAGNRILVGNATASSSSDTTLFVVDTATTANRPTGQVGAMYYDSTIGRIQCYESDGWGSCGSAPDNIVILTPEFAGATLNGTGIGTLTSDFCAQQSSVLNVNTSLCPTGVARNFYKWTSPQSSQQVYSIYISYKLPSTFSNFADDNTINLTARTDNTTNGAVTYEVYKSTGSAITACGTETAVTNTTDGANVWTTKPINGNERTTCAFAGSNTMIIKINVKSNSNANVYVSELTFTYTNN